jgi:beta-fructofuranosidase
MSDRTEHLSLALSTDGIHFTKTLPNPFASPKPPYKQGPFRDPAVFRDPQSGQFHMLVTAELEHPAVARRGGCLAHLVSGDLRSWEQRDPFMVTGYGDHPECSELFSWGEWYYLVFSHFGYAHYRMSRSPFGPWSAPAVDVIDGPLARVMKSAPFPGNRRIGTFFVAEGEYAGFAVFRELVQRSDGTLGSRWPTEMVPATGHAISPGFTALTAGAAREPRGIRIESLQGFAAAGLSPVPKDMLIRFRVNPAAGARSFGIGVRGSGRFEDALSLQMEPARGKVGWRRARTESWRECETAALYGVEGLDRPFQVELLALGDILDVCIDGRRTLINHDLTGQGDALFFFCHDGAVGFEEIEIRPVMPSP